MKTIWYACSRIRVPETAACRNVREAPLSRWRERAPTRGHLGSSGIMVSPDASEYEAVTGVVWSAPMWYSIGTISRSAVCAGFTRGRTEW